jgi:hypothetical protein
MPPRVSKKAGSKKRFLDSKWKVPSQIGKDLTLDVAVRSSKPLSKSARADQPVNPTQEFNVLGLQYLGEEVCNNVVYLIKD